MLDHEIHAAPAGDFPDFSRPRLVGRVRHKFRAQPFGERALGFG